MENVACLGNENHLLACVSSPIFSTGTCSHAEDAGVVCQGIYIYNDYTMRFM